MKERGILYEGMKAEVARAVGIDVPPNVPGGAVLRLRGYRLNMPEGWAEFDPSIDYSGELITREAQWSWRWEMAFHVGPTGARENGTPPSDEAVMAAARKLIEGFPGHRQCSCPRCELALAFARFDSEGGEEAWHARRWER